MTGDCGIAHGKCFICSEEDKKWNYIVEFRSRHHRWYRPHYFQFEFCPKHTQIAEHILNDWIKREKGEENTLSIWLSEHKK